MKRLVFLILLPFTLFANLEDQNIIRGSAYGENVVQERKSDSGYNYQTREFFQREALYNFYLWNRANNNVEVETRQASLINIVDTNSSSNIPQTIASEDSNATVFGFCLIRDDINVGYQPSGGKFICNTNIGQLEIFGNLTPVNKAYTLIYDPAYIEFKNWRYKVISSRVLNEARTSYNIATFVNDRKLATIALESTSQTADVFKTQSSEYLQEVKDSRKNETVEYVQVGSGGSSYVAPVQSKNTEEPKASDYIIKGAIDIVSGIVKTTADVLKKDLPFLYEVKGGSKIYIDLIIDKKGEPLQ
ncbi:hypothetical protein KDE13_09035 [Campylobacter sp. faydin G-140]|uniref:hypothetical protein n=1 Tax=Campylobacter anatolicus TaxID=2829105 RepID=UPI001B989156|nr:hypothetical protein [Campylobacter anatolicus]MBR8466477.1 hypothetical protein [Campylobacter anatolicus]